MLKEKLRAAVSLRGVLLGGHGVPLQSASAFRRRILRLRSAHLKPPFYRGQGMLGEVFPSIMNFAECRLEGYRETSENGQYKAITGRVRASGSGRPSRRASARRAGSAPPQASRGNYPRRRASGRPPAASLVGELAFWKKILSLEHTNDLASEYRDRARSLLERLPPTSEFDRPYTATGLNAHACVLWDHGDLAGARPRFERALAISEKTRSPNHPDTATFLNNLAIVLRDQGDLAGARQRFERALAIWESGPNHPDTAAGLNNLAIMFRDQGEFADARERFERALDIWEVTAAPTIP